MITSIGIRYLSDMQQNNRQSLPDLSRFALNYNILGNQSVPYLNEFCLQLPALQILELRSTDITEISSHNMELIKLTSIDISFNTFTSVEFGKILKNVNFSIIRELNLAFCLNENQNNAIGDVIARSMNCGTCQCLEIINLSGLHLNDSDAYSIISSITRSIRLKEINFSDNFELSPIVLQLLLERVTVDSVYLENCRIFRNLSAFDCSIQPINVADVYAKNLFFTMHADELDSLKKLFYRLYSKQRCHFKLMKRNRLHVQIGLPIGDL